MISTVCALTGILLLVAAPVGTAAQRSAPAKCPPTHSRLIAADAQAQVYEGREDEVFGCTYSKKRSFSLGHVPTCGSSGCLAVEREVLAGPIVAYEETSIGGVSSTSSEWRVVVRDLRTGRVLHRVPTGTPSPPNPSLVGDGFAVAIVVKSDGAVAWIVQNGVDPSEYEVQAVDKTGSRLLAASAAIDPSSLALGGSTLYWTEAGKPMSAPLS